MLTYIVNSYLYLQVAAPVLPITPPPVAHFTFTLLLQLDFLQHLSTKPFCILQQLALYLSGYL